MLTDSFLDYLRYERNYSEKTVLAYSEDIKQLQEFAQEEYGRFNPLEVEAELIREWIVSLMDKGYASPATIRCHRCVGVSQHIQPAAGAETHR